MDVSRPRFSRPIDGNLVTIDVTWRSSGRSQRMVSYADRSGHALQPAGRSFADALSSAVALSRADQVDAAVAILQARDGSYHLTKLSTVVPLDEGLLVEVDARIDGRVEDALSGRRPADIGAAHAVRTHADLRAVVGAYSWIDLRSDASADRSRLPRLHP